MNKTLKNTFSIIFVIMLMFILIGCGEEKAPVEKETYDEANYGLRYNYTFVETLDYNGAKELYDKALNTLNEAKNYSYSQTIKGVFEDDVTYTGTTKINVSDKVEASMELNGNLEFAMYIKDNKAYIQNNNKKYYMDIEANGSNLNSLSSKVLGKLPSLFSLSDSNFSKAGKDENNVYVIEYSSENEDDNEGTINVIIYKDKIQKVLYYDDSDITYVANYDYNAVTITYPSDLSEYEKQ